MQGLIKSYFLLKICKFFQIKIYQAKNIINLSKIINQKNLIFKNKLIVLEENQISKN